VKNRWKTSLNFRRLIVGLGFVVAAVLVSLGSHVRRSVSLPDKELNDRGVARVGDEQIVIERPKIGEGDLVLSYVGSKNEVADLWLYEATVEEPMRKMLFPNSAAPGPGEISYTTGDVSDAARTGDTCHTTVEVRRVKGTPEIDELKLYQTETMAGAQRFRQLVLDAGKGTMEVSVHTDAPETGGAGVAGCHKVLAEGDGAAVDLPLLPVRMLVHGGKINLHFDPSDPAVQIFTGPDQTFEAVSLGEGELLGSGLRVVTVGSSKEAPFEMRAANVKSCNGAEKSDSDDRIKNCVAFRDLKLGADTLRVGMGRDGESAYAWLKGESLYTYDLMDEIDKNRVVSAVFAVVVLPFMWRWIGKTCFPGLKHELGEDDEPHL
jgi:hypothetical protein